MEREKNNSSESYVLRTHHLCVLEDFLSEFFKYSEGAKPWEYTKKTFYKLSMFAKEYATKEAGMDLTMRNYFERSIIESPSAQEDYEYVIDLIGTTKDEFETVVNGRRGFFMGLLETAFNGKDNKIFLINESDDYCRSCAIGKHCTDKNTAKVNMDAVYQEALGKLMCGFEGIGREDDKLFVTAELFFDPAFYKALEPMVESIFQRELKSL